MQLRTDVSRRGAVLIAVVGVMMLGAGWTAVTTWFREDPPNEPGEVDVDAARSRGRAACTDIERVEDLIDRDASVDEVRAALQDAERHATGAADVDPQWRPLAGGVHALQTAIEHNDARAARVGIDVVRNGCADVTRP